jgi:preprotein translocase subunit SecE
MADGGRIQASKVFVGESVDELRKVTWPDYPQLKNATLVVLFFVFMVSAIIWLMDVSVRAVVNSIMGIFGA